MTPFTAPDYLSCDYLSHLNAAIEVEQIEQIRQMRLPKLTEPRIQPYAAAVDSVSDVESSWFNLSGSVVKIGRNSELTYEESNRIQAALNQFRPWKKGPFEIFGTEINAEWRSDWKWERILPHIQPLAGRRVADIGCHNGYFMFRMAHQEPEFVIGFEPVAKHYWNFQLLQQWIRQPNLHFELLGVEHVNLYPNFFDTIFCLGILYHHTDPVGLLRKLREALAPKGEIIIDCQGIPGSEPVALVPKSRYARARGIWFLPTQSCLENWMSRAGFKNLHCFFAEPLSIEEQRRTPWADVESLAEFLDPRDSTRTVEGYPRPWRYYVRGEG
ncbi:MAG: tRNA 5-methoxyuridine(34)/uridine 5-oxyacetic acid(34) synthase CmoB [Chloroflexota bacterium]